jgi:hypothetical protein
MKRAHALILAGLALAAALPAHGGSYRGLPAARGGVFSPPRYPLPPGAPGPGNPLTLPGAMPAPAGPDLASWSVWWEFNKDPYLRLREAVHELGPVSGSDEFYLGGGLRERVRDTMAPSAVDRREQVLPALRRALERTRNRDIVTACLIAIAKLGMDDAGGELRALFEVELKRGDQEIRETATVAMGITRQAWAIAPLAELLADSPAGRKLVDRGEVSDRTRAFAAYGLGLIAWHADADGKRRVYEALKGALAEERTADRDVQVAVLQALGLLEPRRDGKERRLLWECVALLHGHLDKSLGKSRELVQAHGLTALARLLGRGSGPEHARAKELLLERLRGRKFSAPIRQAAALALGEIVEPPERAPDDRRYCEALADGYRQASDQQQRYFCLIALGSIGGESNQEALIDFLRRAKGEDVGWAALALGVLGFEVRGAVAQGPHPIDRVGDVLLDQLGRASGPSERGAFAVALGLCRYRPAGPELRELLAKSRGDDELAGYVCIGLALLDDDRAIADIRALVEKSVRRPGLLEKGAIALGKLGDRDAARLLVQLMTEGEVSLARLGALAIALGLIGDRRSLPPLLELLEKESLPNLSRAFVAAALGGICEDEDLPWNAKLAVGTNYRANVDSLTDGQSGVLDIL